MDLLGVGEVQNTPSRLQTAEGVLIWRTHGRGCVKCGSSHRHSRDGTEQVDIRRDHREASPTGGCRFAPCRSRPPDHLREPERCCCVEADHSFTFTDKAGMHSIRRRRTAKPCNSWSSECRSAPVTNGRAPSGRYKTCCAAAPFKGSQSRLTIKRSLHTTRAPSLSPCAEAPCAGCYPPVGILLALLSRYDPAAAPPRSSWQG
jgi:hypothetical protein